MALVPLVLLSSVALASSTSPTSVAPHREIESGEPGGAVITAAPTPVPAPPSASPTADPAGDGLATPRPQVAVTLRSPATLGSPSASPTPTAVATPEPTAKPTAKPTPKPTPAATQPPAPPSSSHCPIAMPQSAPQGWTRASTSTFSETTALGSWPGPIAAQSWRNRDRGPDSSERGTYDSSKTVSERDGLLDVWVHSEGGTRYVAAPVSKVAGQGGDDNGPTDWAGARISVCMRADVIPGYKIAFLLWPGSTRGEIDFPEGKLNGGDSTPKAFMHHVNDDSQDAYDSGVSVQGWHAYTIEWNPKANTPYVKFFVDGTLIGHSTHSVPTQPMFYVMQIETYLKGDPLPPPAEGHVQIDWVTIDVP